MEVLVVHGHDEHGPAGRGFVVDRHWRVTLEQDRPTLDDVLEALLDQADLPEHLAAHRDYLHVLPIFDLAARSRAAKRGAPLIQDGDRFRLLRGRT